MPHLNIFRWQAGLGWLVLSGGLNTSIESTTAIEANMLNRTVSQGPMVYIWAASDLDTADHHMDSLRDLGARTGYLVDILTEEDDELFEHLSEAGIIVLGHGPNIDTLRDALAGVVMRGLEAAFSRGATIYALGDSAALLSTFAIRDDALVAGFDWLKQSIVLPGYTPEDADLLRHWVQTRPNGYGLGLGHGAALALGPRGEVEVWGNPSITVSLGRNYTPDADSSTEE